jgi:sarcosine oxidase subunit gamma
VVDALRVFAFDAFAAAAEERDLASPGVTIASRRAGAMFNVRGNPRDGQFMRDAAAVLHVQLPVVPNTASRARGMRALWLGPDEWLIVSAVEFPSSSSFRVANGTLTDVSHGRAVLRLSGPDVCQVLAKGCPLDLDVRDFPVGACAQTAIAKINVILDRVQPQVFDLYCPRSHAGSFWHFVTDAAAEYGCNIVRPQ